MVNNKRLARAMGGRTARARWRARSRRRSLPLPEGVCYEAAFLAAGGSRILAVVLRRRV